MVARGFFQGPASRNQGAASIGKMPDLWQRSAMPTWEATQGDVVSTAFQPRNMSLQLPSSSRVTVSIPSSDPEFEQ